MNWRKLKLGDPILFYGQDFSGKFSFNGYVEKIFEDHVIVKADGMNLWLDDDTKDLFKLLESEARNAVRIY